MKLLRRIVTWLALGLALGLAGCSSLTLAYNQLPLLGSLWIDSYLDLDSAQTARMRDKLRAWQTWHRREELPQWQSLLRQARAALADGPVTSDDLLALEVGVRASLERCLLHAASLTAPVLADLRPAQWQHLQKKLDDNTTEWREKMSGRDGTAERARRYVATLDRWLGDLDRTTRKQARADAEAWNFDLATLTQARATRQAHTLEALRAWAHNDLTGGTATLMRFSQTLPAEQPYREEITTSLLRLINGMDARQREQVRRHWADWTAELASLQAG